MMLRRGFASTAKVLEATSLSRPYKFVQCTNTKCDCELPELPDGVKVDHEARLRGTAVALYKHVLVLSGNKDHENWPRRFEMSPGSIISEISMLKRKYTRYPSLVSMTSFEEKGSTPSSSVLALYPDGIVVDVPKDRIKEFVSGYLGDDADLRASFNGRKLDKDYILVCGHHKRDARCGILGPVIAQQFKQTLKEKKVLSVEVGYISHVGGHAYAANVLIFKRNGDVLWYGRVEPKHVAGIVDKTVLGNEVIEEIYRG